MSLQAVIYAMPHVPEGETALAAAIVALAVDDLKYPKRKPAASKFLYGDWCAHLLAGLGFDAGNIRAALERTCFTSKEASSQRDTPNAENKHLAL